MACPAASTRLGSEQPTVSHEARATSDRLKRCSWGDTSWGESAHGVVHDALHIVHDIPHIEHDAQAVHEAGGRLLRGVHVVPRREGVGVRERCEEHLDAYQEALQAGRHIILAVCLPFLHARVNVFFFKIIFFNIIFIRAGKHLDSHQVSWQDSIMHLISLNEALCHLSACGLPQHGELLRHCQFLVTYCNWVVPWQEHVWAELAEILRTSSEN